MHALALHDAGRLELESTTPHRRDRPESVDRVAERVDDATQVAVTHGDGEDLTRAADFLSGFDAGELAEDDDTDFVLVQVQREARRAVGEGHELVGHDTGQALEVRDAVGRVDDRADLGRRGAGGLVRGGEVLQRVTDDIGADR